MNQEQMNELYTLRDILNGAESADRYGISESQYESAAVNFSEFVRAILLNLSLVLTVSIGLYVVLGGLALVIAKFPL